MLYYLSPRLVPRLPASPGWMACRARGLEPRRPRNLLTTHDRRSAMNEASFERRPSITSLKWIIFDAMGVLFTVGDDTQDLLIPYLRDKNCSLPDQAIKQVYLKASLGHPICTASCGRSNAGPGATIAGGRVGSWACLCVGRLWPVQLVRISGPAARNPGSVLGPPRTRITFKH